jgi:hypothetical protein
MLVGTVCLIFGGIALLSALGHERGGFPTLVMKEGEKTLQLPACKYISVEKAGVEYEKMKPGLYEVKNDFTFLDMPFILTDTAETCPVLTIDAGLEQMMEMVMHGDTLNLEFSISQDMWPEESRGNHFLGIYSLPMKLSLPEDVALIKMGIDVQRVEVERMERKSLQLDFPGEYVNVSDCCFDTLRVENVRKVDFTKGRAGNLYVNCDRVNSWWVRPEFQVDTEYLSGSGITNNQLHSNECRRVIWTPTGENAKMNVEISCPVEILVKE